MKKEEFDILGIKKSKEGKSYGQIKKEINQLEDFQKECKSDKKVIIKQRNLIEKLGKKIIKLEKEIFNLGLRDDGEDKESKNVTVGDLRKVVSIVLCDTVPEQEIRALCNMDLKKTKIALNYLKRTNQIIEERTKGVSYYKKC